MQHFIFFNFQFLPKQSTFKFADFPLLLQSWQGPTIRVRQREIFKPGKSHLTKTQPRRGLGVRMITAAGALGSYAHAS